MPGKLIDTKDYFIHPTSEVDENVHIGKDTKVWHFSHILKNTRIGERCNLGQNVVVGPNVTIGNGCKIQNNVSIYKGVTLERDVFCGPSIVFTNVFNPRSQIKRMDEIRPTLVKKGASLGANCTIVCGVTIGRYSFIGAGAVVTKDVLDHALVVGNPAKQTGWVCECGEKLDKNMNCDTCDKNYIHLLTAGEQRISFIDLSTQQRCILPKIEENIQKVLMHGQYIMGPEIKELEERLAEFVGVKHALTCASGTDALLMALMAYGVGPGDAVFTTPFTFVATAEAICLVGATPVFVDIEPETYNLSPENLEKAILAVQQNNPSEFSLAYRTLRNNKTKLPGSLTPKAIIPVDLFGLPCDYDQIGRIAKKHGLGVIEDAAQSFGGEYKGQKAGSFGNIGCTSFFPAKPLGCYGDGGAVFTDSDDLADKITSIRIHGKGKDKYDNIRLGLNSRLDTIQAAILLGKLDIFPQEFQKRQKVAQLYTRLLSSSKIDVLLPEIPENFKSAWAQYSILLRDESVRRKIQEKFSENKIPTAIYYPVPLHLQGAFSHFGYSENDMPVSEEFSKRILSLPMHPYLTENDQVTICELLRATLNE